MTLPLSCTCSSRAPCCRLNPLLPSLMDEEGNAVQFRRTLLNKCQEEFEAGVTAMKAVSEREKHAKEKGEAPPEEGQVGGLSRVCLCSCLRMLERQVGKLVGHLLRCPSTQATEAGHPVPASGC